MQLDLIIVTSQLCVHKVTFLCKCNYQGAGGGLTCETGGDAPQKIGIKPLKETNLGKAQALFDPQKIPF